MDKQALIEQLARELAATAQVAGKACADAEREAREGATAKERRADARVQIEFQSLALGQGARAERVRGELRRLNGFAPERLPRGAPIEAGAIVEVEDEESGEGRTFFLAPAGAGVTLSGPGGDGLISVVTPASPLGRAVMGARLGDTVEVTVRGASREWTITWVE